MAEFSDLPLNYIDDSNKDLVEFLTIDTRGRLFKSKATQIAQYLSDKVPLDTMIVEDGEPFLLGRYEPGEGTIQRIRLGNNLDFNSSTNSIEVSDNLSGSVSGDLEGTYPDIFLKDGVVRAEHIADFGVRTILGESGLITLGSEFVIDEDKTLRLTSAVGNISSVGLVPTIITEAAFTCTHGMLYFIDSLEVVVATIPDGWSLGQQVTFVRKNGNQDILVATPNKVFSFIQMGISCLTLITDGMDFYPC